MKDLSKLPLWAQQEIRRLENELASANMAISLNDVHRSDITWREGLKDRHGLPRYAVIDFVINNRTISFSKDKDGVRVSSSDSRISVIPSASNSFFVLPIE